MKKPEFPKPQIIREGLLPEQDTIETKYRNLMTKITKEQLGSVKSNNEIIGETIGFFLVVGLFGWALVSFFPLTWGQALIISWVIHKLFDVIRYIGK